VSGAGWVRSRGGEVGFSEALALQWRPGCKDAVGSGTGRKWAVGMAQDSEERPEDSVQCRLRLRAAVESDG